eukprot:871851-Pleurochrysis_carterae.AAC.1
MSRAEAAITVVSASYVEERALRRWGDRGCSAGNDGATSAPAARVAMRINWEANQQILGKQPAHGLQLSTHPRHFLQDSTLGALSSARMSACEFAQARVCVGTRACIRLPACTRPRGVVCVRRRTDEMAKRRFGVLPPSSNENAR